jgi:crossover junction endodeoxyribonuclease RuvC
MRVLGIDTSLRCTGLGVVETAGSRLAALEYGTLKMPQRLPLSECLKGLLEGVGAAVDRTKPDAVAIEGAFFFKNAGTAMILGQARGVAIAACAARSVPVYEYAPRRVKQAVVGYGAAGKEQVQKMILSMLALRGPISEDASDALALAICHLHNRSGHAALMPPTI